MTKKFYVVSYKDGGWLVYFAQIKKGSIVVDQTEDIYEARRYETFDKAMKLINLKKRDMVRHNLPGKFTDFEIHEIEITINVNKVTKVN